jgi:hypothetical protein
VSQCPNRSAAFEGRYGSGCGQRRIDPGDLSARRRFHEAADQVATSALLLLTFFAFNSIADAGAIRLTLPLL